MRNARVPIVFLFVVSAVFAPAIRLRAQVTTATLFGIVRDTTGAVLPGASVTLTNEGTGLVRNVFTDVGGEFVATALPAGSYILTIELTGFKTLTNRGLQLSPGQTSRQTFQIQLGGVEESVTVQAAVPLIETASSKQALSHGTEEVNNLPLQRRNVTGMLSLAPGADSNAGNVRLNGVAAGGTGITVDGTEANSNPEGRSMAQYGGQNQIDVMSIESVAEVQVVKGILPAEYGGVTGGQVNLISRSGTNAFRGSVFENYQGDMFYARDRFLAANLSKPSVRFNQYGGSAGGPIKKNRAFFFGTYEGYQENAGIRVIGTVPTPALRNQLLAALPFPETKIALDALPLPNEPISDDVGRFNGVGTRLRHENHIVAKSDVTVVPSGNLSVTYTRMRPFTRTPTATVDGINDRDYPNKQDRVAAQFVLAHGSFISESRFGWNKTDLARLDGFFGVMQPGTTPADEAQIYDRRVGLINISGLFSTPSAEIYDLSGVAYSAEQKFSRLFAKHLIKVGGRWVRQGGDRENPQNPSFRYQNKADALANISNQVIGNFGAPPHKSHLDEYGAFIQDDWRATSRLVFNLGLRYDYYSTIIVQPTTDATVEIVNMEPASSLQAADWHTVRDPLNPYNADGMNFGPRAGFAWTLNSAGDMVLRGGSGVLFSPQLPATVRQGAADPLVPFRSTWAKPEATARSLTWPMYTVDLRGVALTDGGGKPAVFSILDTNLSNPYTVQSMVSIQKALGTTLMAEVGYIRTDGRDFPLQRLLSMVFDRQTGARPAAWTLGSPGGYYLDSSQTMDYNGLQVSVRKRSSSSVQFEGNYTLSKGTATQGGDLQAYYLADVGNLQDFYNPEADRTVVTGDVRHRFVGDVIYQLPWLKNGSGVAAAVLGGWQLSGILAARSGTAILITQPSGMANSRPDYVPGTDPVLQDWSSTLVYLNKAAFSLVPTSSVTTATLRPGNAPPDLVRGPMSWTVDMTIAKNIPLGHTRLQLRADAFNVLNHVNLNNPNGNFISPDFGRITAAATMRTGQVGVRMTF
jgi:outer membrane receptor protein involved in Fe transport